MADSNSPSFGSIASVAFCALLVVVLADVAIQRVLPLAPRIPEVDDGVAAYRDSDPKIVTIGSSHARSFGPIGDLLSERDGGRRDMVVVPVEWGSFSSFNWVLQHRLKGLIDERDEAGLLKRRSLNRAILVTTFYDLCPNPSSSSTNLPARAWTESDFVADLREHGLTDFNRNYLRRRISGVFSASVLMQDRGYNRITKALGRLMRGSTVEDHAAERIDPDSETVRLARRQMEIQYGTCDDNEEKEELGAMLDFFQKRNVEVTVVLFPIAPTIITEQSKETTLRRYANYVAELSQRRGFRMVDLTFKTPLGDDDFELDLDHVRRDGNRKLAAWALDNDLKYLSQPPTLPQSAATGP